MMAFNWTWRELMETPVIIVRRRQLVEAVRNAVIAEEQAKARR